MPPSSWIASPFRAVRRHPAIAKAFLCALILLNLFLAWFAIDSKWRRSLQAELDAIRAAGEPLHISEMVDQDVPPEQDAGPLYLQAFDIIRKAERDWTQGSFWIRQGDDSEETADEVARAGEALGEIQDALDLLRKAAEKPHCRFPAGYSSFQGAPGLKCMDLYHASHPLETDLQMALWEGDMARFEGDVLAILRLADAVQSEPNLMTGLFRDDIVRLGTSYLGAPETMGRLGPDRCRRLAAALEAFSAPGAMERSLLGERCAVIATWGRLGARPAAVSVRGLGNPYPRMEMTYHLRYMAELIRISRLSYAEGRVALAALKKKVDDAPFYVRAAPSLLISPMEAMRHEVGNRVWRQTLAVALRVEAFRGAHGEYPETIEEIGTDPYTGKPYIYRGANGGCIIYSAGPDGIDDGGKLEYVKGEAPDMGWRLK